MPLPKLMLLRILNPMLSPLIASLLLAIIWLSGVGSVIPAPSRSACSSSSQLALGFFFEVSEALPYNSTASLVCDNEDREEHLCPSLP